MRKWAIWHTVEERLYGRVPGHTIPVVTYPTAAAALHWLRDYAARHGFPGYVFSVYQPVLLPGDGNE